MTTAIVYRPEVDRRGDPVGDGTAVANVSGIIMGGQSTRLRNGRGETTDTTGQVGLPGDQFKVRKGDRLVIDGVSYVVLSCEFAYPSSITGHVFPFYWCKIQA